MATLSHITASPRHAPPSHRPLSTPVRLNATPARLSRQVTTASLDHWLEELGYSDEPELLHRAGNTVPPLHPYALEIRALLNPDGSIGARAVFDVEGVPTIVFLEQDLQSDTSSRALDDARQRIWNQNLATVVIHVCDDQATALPARKLKSPDQRLRLDQARRDGPFSASDIVSANLTRRLPEWFDPDARVDHKLLENISATIRQLTNRGFDHPHDERHLQQCAELLMAEILFVSYLEHRNIVAHTYRDRRRVGRLHDLVRAVDRDGVQRLIDALRSDFNGDFLTADSHDPWTVLADPGFDLVNEFLSRTDMRTGQGDFWNYDFSYIPVELLSGLYELFLSPTEQTNHGAFYTPRHLAALAVDQAFVHSEDPLAETIFDGACGSGILLTTAYRRLIALSEQARGRSLAFNERCELVQQCIFGGDINPMACRVTAFSLYLSIFEDLDPSDIMEAQERHAAQLPTLTGTNLASGPNTGDFFTDKHAFAERRFSLLISNPPWREPERDEQTTADEWANQTGEPFARRQIAGAYAIRALDFLRSGGRACLILPIGQLLGDTSAAFVARLLHRYKPQRIINFGDLQGLLFPTTEHTCHLFTGQRRPAGAARSIPFRETFEYCVPKADLTLALGHLTLQSADLHRLQTVSVADNPQQLVARMWGDASDIAIWTRLATRGTLAQFAKSAQAPSSRVCRKGITSTKTATLRVPKRVATLPYIDPAVLDSGSPILHPHLLQSWPPKKYLVTPPSDSLMRIFDGPRVVFPDGFSQIETNLRSHYYEHPATFTHSIGVIASTDTRDAPLLKFAAVYLRSPLARYFLMLRTWKMLCERNAVHLTDIKSFPFFEPAAAPDTAAATRSLTAVSAHMDDIAALPFHNQAARYHELRREFDQLVYAYFGLTPHERALIQETVDVLMPSVRPRSLGSLYTPAQEAARPTDYKSYAKALGESLTRWRTKMRGAGRFSVLVTCCEPEHQGASGIVRVDHFPHQTADAEINTSVDEDLVFQTLAVMRKAGLRRIRSGTSLGLVPDTHIWLKGSLYLARPANRRSWTVRQALRDAEQIVRLVQSETAD